MRVELESRPAVICSLGLLFGILISQSPWLFAISLLIFVFLQKPFARLIFLMTLLVGRLIAPAVPKQFVGPPTSFFGRLTVVSVPQISRSGFTADVKNESGTYWLSWKAPELSYGDEIRASGKLTPLSPQVRKQVRFADIIASIRAEDGGVSLVSKGPKIFDFGSQWRAGFVKFSSRSIPEREAQVLPALCFNIDSLLSQELIQNLQRTGTIHIISASGAHVLILAVTFLFLLSQLPIPRHIQILILGAILFVYAAGAGFRPPIVRAVLMSMVGLGAYWFRREPDWLSALAVSLIAYLLWSPISVYDLGFQLSFVTVGALAMFLPRLEPLEGTLLKLALSRVKQLATASLIASVASAPLVAYYFGQISLISVPANLLIAPLIAPILVIAMLAYPLSAALPTVAQGLMGAIVAPLIALLEFWVGWMASLPFAVLQVPEFSGYWLPIIYGLLLVLWRPRARLA